jgi:GntR family transcriptional regulator
MSRSILRIDLGSPVPAYRQIADGVRALLVEGHLAPGGKLPTVRRLAIDLGVHHNTVAEAYRLLANEGWIEMRRRHGVTILDRKKPRASEQSKQSFLRRLRELAAEAQASGVSARTIAGALRTVAARVDLGEPVEE